MFFAHHSVYAQINDETGRLLGVIRSNSPDSEKIDAYEALCQYYMYVHFDSALYYANKGLEYARKKNDIRGQGILYLRLAAVYEKHNQLAPANEYGQQSLKLLQQAGYDNGIAGTYSLLGVIMGKKGQLKEATEYFLKALKLYEQVKNNTGVVQTYVKLGIVNDQSGNLDKALQYYTKARDLNINQPISNAGFTLLNNIGIVYAKQGNVKEALEYFRQGVQLSDSPQYAGVHIALLGSMGNALELTGQHKEALAVQYKVLDKARQYHIPEEEARSLNNIADLIKYDSIGQSIVYLKQAIAIANEIENVPLAIDAWLLVSDIEEEKGRYKEALEATRMYELLKDSLQNAEKSLEIAQMQTMYDLQKSEAEVEKLQTENARRTRERNAMTVIFVCALAIGFVLWRYYQYARKLNVALKKANDVKDKLFSIIGHDLKGPMNSQLQLLELIQAGVLTPEEQEQMLAELKKNGETTLDTLNSLLQWGKAQLKGLHINQVSFASRPVIEKNIEALRTQASQKDISVVNQTNGAQIHADTDHFNFIVRNLLANAIKFSHPGSQIEINADEQSKKDAVIFSVKDNGIGISQEKLNALFEDNQVLAEGTYGEKGTGLGLMLCNEYVKANGGKIWVNSREGEGTTFYFSLKKS